MGIGVHCKRYRAVSQSLRDNFRFRPSKKHKAGTTPWMVRAEEKRSAIFRRNVAEAKAEGTSRMADEALLRIRAIVFGQLKADGTTLTATLALANAFAPGFKT